MNDAPLVCPSCGTLIEHGHSVCPRCAQPTETAGPDDGRSPWAASKELGAGGRIGEFRILRTIGRGGMGTVYEAWQESMRRKVALKILNEAAFPSDQEITRFEREAWIGGRLNHANIVKVHGQGSDGATHWIAMEVLEGPSLYALICEERKAPRRGEGLETGVRRERVRRLVELFVGVADALAHVHAQGIVHRDIKPLNLLLTADRRRMLLTDFGLARDEAASRMTRRGDFLGTIRYMSPEQLLAHRVRVDHRSDIWSVGVSLYEAVTLDLPYSGDTEEAYLTAHHQGAGPGQGQEAVGPA